MMHINQEISSMNFETKDAALKYSHAALTAHENPNNKDKQRIALLSRRLLHDLFLKQHGCVPSELFLDHFKSYLITTEDDIAWL